MFSEANVTSSACRLWRIAQVETSAPPVSAHTIRLAGRFVKSCAVIKIEEKLPSFLVP